MAVEERHLPYAKETALCVEFAYTSVVDDIRAELDRPGGPAADALQRLLQKVEERRALLDQFTKATNKAA